MVVGALERAGFRTAQAADTNEANQRIGDGLPGLILLDWMLPGTSGIEFARRLKRDAMTREVPIILLTARGEESDKVTGFEAGIDDYISKPFSVREMVARIKAVLRRAAPENADDILEVEGLRLDPVRHRVTANGEQLKMSPTEFRLLNLFMSHPDRVFSRGQLLDRVWGNNVYVEERTVDVHIRRLRKSLSGHQALIQTVHGTGYRFSIEP